MGHRILYIPKPIDEIFYPEYGLLYNWYAATDTKKISSSDDWVVPTYNTGDAIIRYETLRQYLGATVAGKKLKEDGIVYWNTNNGTNEVDFNGRGAGYRTRTSGFNGILISCMLMTQTLNDSPDNAIIYVLTDTNDTFPPQQNSSYSGYSLRLVRTSTTLSDGQTGTYTGNDGKVYRTICIGTQEFLADCLAETRFRDNSIIPWYGADAANYFTDAEWDALTTAGCCAYNNTESNVATGFSFPT